MKRFENIVALTICLVFGAFGVFLVRAEDTVSTSTNRKELSEIHFLNVGQGDAILFEQGEVQTLVDTGPDGAILSELGRVMPVADRSLENIIITHPHADHLGGLGYIFKAYSVDKVYFNGVAYNSPQFKQFMVDIRTHLTPVEKLYAGKKLLINDLSLNVVWPPENLRETRDANETSIVMVGRFKATSVVLTGDASAKILDGLKIGPADILKISHHGSKTGTDKKFISDIKPKYAVITVGKNSYGHPAPSVLSLLSGIPTFRTDKNGATSFWVNDTGVFLY